MAPDVDAIRNRGLDMGGGSEHRGSAGRRAWPRPVIRSRRSHAIALIAGIAIGAALTSLTNRPQALAELRVWLPDAPAKDAARLPTSADITDLRAAAGGCTALVRDRLTGSTAAIACLATPKAPPTLRLGEIES
jgi:hypothetical protein